MNIKQQTFRHLLQEIVPNMCPTAYPETGRFVEFPRIHPVEIQIENIHFPCYSSNIKGESLGWHEAGMGNGRMRNIAAMVTG